MVRFAIQNIYFYADGWELIRTWSINRPVSLSRAYFSTQMAWSIFERGVIALGWLRLLLVPSAIITIVIILILIARIIIYLFNKKNKRFPRRLLYITLFSIFMCLVLYVPTQFFFTFDSINRAYMQQEPRAVLSPSKQYEAQINYELYGGAAGGVNVFVEVTDLHTNTTKVIYLADAQSTISVAWIDEIQLHVKNLSVTDDFSITLNVKEDIYHQNGLACKSLRMKDDYINCYSN